MLYSVEIQADEQGQVGCHTRYIVDSSTFGMDFTHFKDPLPNTVYACHDYSRYVSCCRLNIRPC